MNERKIFSVPRSYGRLIMSKNAVSCTLIVLTLAAGASAQIRTVSKISLVSRSTRAARAVTRAKLLDETDRLIKLGYWLGPSSGAGGPELHSAVIAFQKVEGLPVTGALSDAEVQSLDTAEPPTPKETGYVHIEVDLDHQVLFWVDSDGTVSKILPISSGSGRQFESEGWTRTAVTPTGRFQVSKKLEGWERSPLGMLYYPNFIVGGIAIHGEPSVPTHPASHGCIRIPMFAAKEFSEMTPAGTVVLVYGGPERTPDEQAQG
jgi:hypothetical protein